MEELHSNNNESSVVGASAATQYESAQPINPLDQSDLPMIVWLKGDEPFADEFSLDADAAMAALGIKRSRLTQISGRELRVGRIRIDRYTRPVYRREDVEIYKQWTRPTATHLRSSSVITDAAKKLEQHTEQITQELKEGLSEQVASLAQALAELRGESQEQNATALHQIKETSDEIKQSFLLCIEGHQDEFNERTSSLLQEVEGLREQVQDILGFEEKFAELKQALAQQSQQAEIMIQALAQLTEYFGSFTEQQTSSNRDLGKALSLLIQFVRESSRKQEQILVTVRHQMQNHEFSSQTLLSMPRYGKKLNPHHLSRRKRFK